MSQTIAPAKPQERSGLTWQKVILGDWSHFIRDPLDAWRLVFIAGTFVWGLTGHSVTGLIGACLLIVLARVVNLPRFYDFSVLVAMTLIAWGEALGLYDSFHSYDNIVHFTVPLLATGVFYVLLVRLAVLPELRDLKQLHQRLGFFLTVLMMGMAIGAAWEIVEYTLDSTTGSHLIVSTTDTATDLIWDSLGAAGSATILVLWSLGNHSLKRRPGAELADKKFTSFLTVSTRGR